ncbi:hypothetical protein POM88_001478 [Heracleum sosnowskyi]|uniref:RNase H type-1 domain-containing protein n=1 Tax=Heracleum sosnowskyi TaxID=360622 RepID=A0AAD8JDM6_9APIA|nr:hypothetical protein POM88_001478 [Heracleum sosnowskyi]
MEVVWFAPEDDLVKLNVFAVDLTPALANGNHNGVAIIMRDTEGQMLWAAMGPMNNKSKDEAELRAIHSGMVQAVKMKRLRINIETSNRRQSAEHNGGMADEELSSGRMRKSYVREETVVNLSVQVFFNLKDVNVASEKIQLGKENELKLGTSEASKGKEKILTNYAFNSDGLLSQEAIRILDSGELLGISKVFGKPVLDLEKEIAGVQVKDILNAVVLGNVEAIKKVMNQSKKKLECIKIADGSKQDGRDLTGEVVPMVE